MTDLGDLRSTHAVANRRILTFGVFVLLIGIVAAVFAAVLVTDGPRRWAGNSSAIDQTIGFSLGAAIVGVVGGVLLLVKALRSGLNEVFEVYEHGIARGSQSWRWEQVISIDTHRAPRDTGATRFLGTNHRCVVRFTDGARIRFDGLTEESEQLERVVRQHCPSAGPQPHGEQRWRRFGVGWLVVGIVLLGAVVAMFAHLVADDPGYGDGTLALMSVGAIVAFAAGVMCITTFFMARRKG
ncbi:hypothetical protein NLX83_27570 [Allokutzneria sp. A3M-2-11 16]|uniref:hypothetical protein n=1 Tax=Allokutzneria sp. A3M-2-11 16 TaxID=2962043 RepID=UPI0020B7D75C|nr:hypothetical protein [Allokutzneria sp. A3M-2-11 16]MCP3803040.1 hypothetical protein [Allokutzneria sp. A3M-2-11 16]